MEYTLHDSTAYGIYNGLSQLEIKQILPQLAEEANLGILDYNTDKIVEELNKDPELHAAAERTYQPFPVHSEWGEEYKAQYMQMCQGKIAPGRGDVPDDLVAAKIRPILARIYQEVVVPRLERERERERIRTEIMSHVVRVDTQEYEIQDEGGTTEAYIHRVLMPSGKTYTFRDRNVFDFGRVVNYQGGMFIKHDEKVFYSTLSPKGGWVEEEIASDDERYLAYQAACLHRFYQCKIRM